MRGLRAFTANDRPHSRVRSFIARWNGSCENLGAKSQFDGPQPQLGRPQLTSIVTIANEKTSVSLLRVPSDLSRSPVQSTVRCANARPTRSVSSPGLVSSRDQTEVRDSYMTSRIDEEVRLPEC